MARHNALKTDFFVTPAGVAFHRDRKVTPTMRKRIYDRFGGKCQQCGRQTRLFTSSAFPVSAVDRAEIDHVIPLSRGGRTRTENLVLLCALCNRRKSNA